MAPKIQVVNLTGELTVAHVTHYKTTLLQALEKREIVYASLGGATDIDAAGVQLLYAAERFARAKKRQFRLTGPVPDLVAQRIHHGGFSAFAAADGKELEEALYEFGAPQTQTGGPSVEPISGPETAVAPQEGEQPHA